MCKTKFVVQNKTKKVVFIIVILFCGMILLWSCGGSTSNKTNNANESDQASASEYDPKRGEGKYNNTNFKLTAINQEMAEQGKIIASTKCLSCHKLGNERLVGPGWKGVTQRNAPYWIMNFITDPEPMINKDPKLQAQLELCMVRMPNQNVSEDDAKKLLEFMRKNDE